MEGKAAMPGGTDQQQQAIAPTPSMQPVANKTHTNDFFKFKVKYQNFSNQLL